MTDTITTTEKTESTIESTPEGVHEERTIETVVETPAPPPLPHFEPLLGHHCTCAECEEYEEDVAHEIATLRGRVNDLESRLADREADDLGPVGNPPPGDAVESGMDGPAPSVPDAVEGETVVEPTPEIEQRREKPGKLGGGWLF